MDEIAHVLRLLYKMTRPARFTHISPSVCSHFGYLYFLRRYVVVTFVLGMEMDSNKQHFPTNYRGTWHCNFRGRVTENSLKIYYRDYFEWLGVIEIDSTVHYMIITSGRSAKHLRRISQLIFQFFQPFSRIKKLRMTSRWLRSNICAPVNR